jgi:hypothetical protein
MGELEHTTPGPGSTVPRAVVAGPLDGIQGCLVQPWAAVQEMSQLGAPLHWTVHPLVQLMIVQVCAP